MGNALSTMSLLARSIPVPASARLASRGEAQEGARESLRFLAKDARYFELIEETLGPGQFDCRTLVVEDDAGEPCAVQPCFFVDQDLVAAAAAPFRVCVGWLRRVFPRLLRLKMLMVGCAAGEGHLNVEDPEQARAVVAVLGAALPDIARRHGAALVVWKDVPAQYRDALEPLTADAPGAGYARVASMPATRLDLRFAGFEDYLQRHLSHAMRKNLRRKFRVAAKAAPLRMSVVSDVSDIADELHALYAQVLARSPLRFERLTPEFFVEIGRRMPDRARFFLWRQGGRLVAFSLCLVHGGTIYDEYLGLDYRVALDLHLYFLTLRDVLSWAMAQGLATYCSTPLNYDPKLHLGFSLAPLDLYVRAASPALQPLVRRILPWVQPTRAETTLRRFPNAQAL